MGKYTTECSKSLRLIVQARIANIGTYAYAKPAYADRDVGAIGLQIT